MLPEYINKNRVVKRKQNFNLFFLYGFQIKVIFLTLCIEVKR